MAIDIYELLRKNAASSGATGVDDYTAQIRKRLSDTAQARALGGAGPAPSPIPSATSIVPSTSIAPESLLTKSFSARGALKAAGKGALSVLTRRPVGAAAIIAPAVGALASKIAGGSALEGAVRPDLLTNALGEGYARFMPTFLGGLSKESIAAGDSQGASDIGGDFGARTRPDLTGARPTFAPKPVAGDFRVVGDPREYSGSSTILGETPGTENFSPFNSADINSVRRPEPGFGAFKNNATGVVTNLGVIPPSTADFISSYQRSGIPPDRWQALLESEPALKAQGAGAIPVAPVGTHAAAIGALMNIKERTGQATQAQLTDKLLLDYALKAPSARESASKADLHTATLEQARRGADLGFGPSDISLILAGRAGLSPSFGESVTSLPDKTGAITLIQKTGQGAGAVRKVIPQQAPQTASAADFAADVKRLGSRDAVLREYAKQNITPPRE